METNLIQDAKVVLNDIEIKARRLGDGGGGGGSSHLRVSGCIGQIEFSWVWDSASLIKDVRLVVRGVSVRVDVISPSDERDTSSSGSSSSSADVTTPGSASKEEEAAAAGNGRDATTAASSDWRAKYMQQIIDHLTLAIEDVTIAIRPNDEESSLVVVVQAKDMELVTMGATPSSALMQNIGLASLEAWIEQGGDAFTKKYPVLEPFGYQATVTRTSGRRFLDGVLSGLFVEGRSIDDSSRESSAIRVHAGIRQIAGLTSLQRVLIMIGYQDECEAGAKNGLVESLQLDPKENQGDKSEATIMSSVFHLPFQSIDVVLENETRLRLGTCNVKYCTDGSELSVHCSGGIWVDDAPFSQGSRWVLDFVSSELILDSLPSNEVYEGDFFYTAHSDGDAQVDEAVDQPDDVTFRLNLTLDMFERIYQGLYAAMPQYAEAKAIVGQAMDQHSQPSSSSWSIRSNGTVDFCLTGKSDNVLALNENVGKTPMLQISTSSPKMIQGSAAHNFANSFECSSIDVTSNVGFTCHVPCISTDEHGCLLMEYRIAATVESMDTLKFLQTLWNQILGIIGDDSSSSGLPIDISLAGFDIAMKEPLGALNLSRIKASGNRLSIGLMQVHDIGKMNLQASSLDATLDGNKSIVSVERIKQFSYDGVKYLAAPIDGATIEIDSSDTLSVALKDVFLKCPEQATDVQSNDDRLKEQCLAVPMSLHLTVDHLRAESQLESFNVDFESVNLWVRPAEELFTVDLDVKSTKAMTKDAIELSCGKINTSIEVGTTCGSGADSEISIPGIGKLSSASMTLHDVVHLSSALGQLNKPLDIVEVSYGGRTLMIKCDKVMFCPKTSHAQSAGGGLSSFNLPFGVYVEVGRFVSMEDFGPGNPGTCCDKLQIHLTPNQSFMNMKAQCNYIQGRGVNHLDFAVKGAKLNLLKNVAHEDTDFLGLKEAQVTFKEVSKLSSPKHGFKLVKPISDPQIELKNNSLDVKCGLLHFSFIQSGEQAMGSEEDEPATVLTEIPVSFCVAVGQLIIGLPKGGVACTQFSAQYMKSSTTSAKSLHVGIASSTGIFGSDRYKVIGVSVSTKWQDAIEKDQGIVIPSLGSLTFAQVELEACSEMITSSFSLIEPIQKPKLVFQQGFLVLELSQIQLDFHSSDHPHADRQSRKFSPDFFTVPIGFNVSDKLRLRAATFDVHLENVGIDYVPSATSPQREVFVHCDKLVEVSMATAKNLDLNFVLSLSDTQKEAGPLSHMMPMIDSVERASIKIQEVTSFSIEKVGRLSSAQPLSNIIISYKDGVFATDIAAVQFECLCLEHSLALSVKKLNVRIQPDPSADRTIHLMAGIGVISGNSRNASFGASGVSLKAIFVPATSNSEVIVSKPMAFPSLGYVSMIVLDISEVPILSIHNVGHLKSPITALAVRFENELISIKCPAVFAQLSMGGTMSSTKKHQGRSPFELPCKATLSIGTLELRQLTSNTNKHREIRCRTLHLTAEPLKVWAGQRKESIRGPGLGVQLIGSDLNMTEGSTVIDIPRISVSGLVQLNDLLTFGNLAIGIEKAQLAAEFSSPNWSGSLENEPPEVVRLPFASIPKFNLALKCVGGLVNINNAVIACDEFEGGSKTTLDQLTNHYIDVVKGRIPFLLAKTDVAGCNVADSFGVMAGKVLMKSSVAGATVGVASRDAIGSALTMGKESRGASSSDKYRFGDLSRGVVSSVKHAANSGANMRGDDSYQVGDFTSGSAKAAGLYASENRCRLAGAGGSAIGMAAGAALLGPVGFIAGSMIGGSAAKSSMAAVTGDPEKDKQLLEASQYLGNHSDSTTQRQSGMEIPNYTQNVAQEASAQQRVRQASAPSLQQVNTAQPPHPQPSTHTSQAAAHQEGYRFGDVTRSVIGRGKKVDGRNDNSGYKFGDFTRGLFG